MPRSDVNKEYYTQNMEREVIIWVLAVIIYDICHLFKKKKLLKEVGQYILTVN